MYFDTHAHLDDEQFDADREELIERMQREGIRPCMTVGANMHMNRIAVELAQRYAGYLYAAVGLHPNDADELNDDTMAQLKAWMGLPCVKAWGEIGLDYHYEDSPSRQVQQAAFAAQLDAARQADKPVILHIREAHGDALAMLRERRGSLPRGVVTKPLAQFMVAGSCGLISYCAKPGESARMPRIPQNSCLAGAPNMGWQCEPSPRQSSQMVVAPFRFM